MEDSSSLPTEQQQQEENDSEVVFKIPPDEWEELMKDCQENFGSGNERIKHFDIETFRKQFMDHPDKGEFLNWRDASIANGATMLICAIWAGRFDLFKLLVEHGADIISIADNDGDTPLNNAADQGHADIVKLLLEKGADSNVANKDGWTALIRASCKGYADIVKLLLNKGADFNVANKSGDTALLLAAFNGHDDIVKLLLEKGVDITFGNSAGQTAVVLAIKKGHNDIVKLLSEKVAEQKVEWKKIIEESWSNLTYKMDIELEIFEKQFKPLMEHPDKAEGINYRDDKIAKGRTMLICAARERRWDIVRLLLEHGADINIADKDGWTALTWVSINGIADIVKLMLEKGADITANKDGKTALTWAIEKGHTEIVKLLAEKAADPNMCISDGQTFLHVACLRNHKREAQPLLEAGINKDLLDGKEHTALFYAAEKGFADVVDVLMKHNVDVDKTDERRLIEKGDGWQRYSFYSVKDGRTPLFVAAQNGHQYVVATLLHHGADPYLCNHESKFPEDVSGAYGAIQQLFCIHRFFEYREKGSYFWEFKGSYKTCKDSYTESSRLRGDPPPLEDIIHDIVKYPHNADKFLELYRENREIVHWLDKDGREVAKVACKECREAILFMGQYSLEDQPNYESPTCKIYNALDYGGPDENLTQPREVAMKFFEEEEHFENELRSRRNENGTPRFSSDFVTPDLAAYRADENPKFAEACKNWKPAAKKTDGSETNTTALPGQCIVMPQAKRSLLESVNAENLSADHKDLPRRGILLNLCSIFSHIHQLGYVHGDIKPHNVVRHMDDGNVTWKAIDFDACTKIGETIGLKFTTGSAPPEMLKIVVTGEEDETEGKLRIVLRKPGTIDGLHESELVKADPSFDVWSYGILMYQLVTGRTFFHCDNQGNLDDDGLQELANLTQADLKDKLVRVKDVNARLLLSKILRLNPEERPTMSAVEQDPYFHPSAGIPSEGGPSITFEYTSNDQEIPNSVGKLIIGENLLEIAKGAFAGNDRLKEIDTSKAHSLEIVGEEAFEGCSALEGFECPSSVKTIQLDSFQGCVKLRGFTFSDAQAALLESIGDRAFYECRALTTFKCPSHVKTIGKYSFHNCQSLQDVDLSEAHILESIEGGAFSFCSAVQKVAIPESVTFVGEGFLEGCDALETLVIAGDNPILYMNVRLRLPETKQDLIPMDSIVKMYSSNPVKKSELLADSNKVVSLLKKVKEGYIESIRGSDNPILKVAKRDGWVQFLSAHADDANEDCIKKLLSFILDSEVKISVVRALADATDGLGRVAKMIAPEHIRKAFEERLFFLGRYDIAAGPPIHKSATCIVVKATDAKMENYYESVFKPADGAEKLCKIKFREILKKMKLISFDNDNVDELFDRADVDRNGTISRNEFVAFCMTEIGSEVVLKLMRNKEQYDREWNSREEFDLDTKYVVGSICRHDTTSDEGLVKSLQDTVKSLRDAGGTFVLTDAELELLEKYCGVFVMPFGDRNLDTIFRSERPGPLAVRTMMQEIGEAVLHLHEKDIVHGDLKMLNVVRINGRLVLIDLDASGEAGVDFMGSKFSSGVLAPEMIFELKGGEAVKQFEAYVETGGNKDEEMKRGPLLKSKKKDNGYAVRSFWDNKKIGADNKEDLPYSEVRHHPSYVGKDGEEGDEKLVRADKSMDVWSFGVLLYTLLTKQPLFQVNNEDDITDYYSMKRLYKWSEDDLISTVEDKVEDTFAVDLLKNILIADPTKRWSMKKVLGHEFFRPHKVKDEKAVVKKLSELEKIALENRIATLENRKVMKKEFDRVHDSLQQIKQIQANANKLLHDIVHRERVPRYCVILPKPDDNGNDDNGTIKNTRKMRFQGFLNKVKDATDPDTYFNEKARLCFICPLSLQPAVDESGEAIGFDITVPKGWVRKYGPALLIGMKVAQVAMSVGRCFGLPLPSLSEAEGALAERSEVVSKLQELLVSGLGGSEGEDGEEPATITDTLTSSLTEKLEAAVSNDIKERLGESYKYEDIQGLLDEESKDIRRDCGLIEAKHQDPEGKVVSEFVRPGWEGVFAEIGSDCFGMSIEALDKAKARLDSLSTTALEESLGPSQPVIEATDEVVGETFGKKDLDGDKVEHPSKRMENDRLHEKLDDMGRKIDELVLQNDQRDNPNSSAVEEQVPIFFGWLSKQSREHSYRWGDRYFKIYASGDVVYYPKGAYPGDQRFGVKLFKGVKWSKVAGEDKLELRSPDKYVLGTVKRSTKDTDSTLDEWLEKGNSWMESPSIMSASGNESKSSSKPRPKGAQATATGDINTLYAS